MYECSVMTSPYVVQIDSLLVDPYLPFCLDGLST